MHANLNLTENMYTILSSQNNLQPNTVYMRKNLEFLEFLVRILTKLIYRNFNNNNFSQTGFLFHNSALLYI